MGMDINIQSFQGVPTKSLAGSVKPQAQADQIGGLLVSELMPKFSNLTYYGRTFSAANPLGITATAFVSGTTTVFVGFCLSNPIGSAVNLHVLDVGYSCMVPPAAAGSIVIGTGYSASTSVTHTTPLVTKNNLLSGAIGVGLADSSYTCPVAPTTNRIIGTLGTGAITTIGMQPENADVEGKIILPPGGFMILASLVAAGASGAFGSATWAELPL